MENNHTILELQKEAEAKTQPKKLPSSCIRCGNEFDKPIFAINTSRGMSEGYYACPRCLSKIENQKEETTEAKQPKEKQENTKNTNTKRIIEVPTPTATCPHYSGYLKKRPKNTPVPEACFLCPEMLECMTR